MPNEKLYYVEVTDDRMNSSYPRYIWQSVEFDSRENALKLARKVAASFGRSDLSFLVGKEYTSFLNPEWEISAKKMKRNLHVFLMSFQERTMSIGFIGEKVNQVF